MKLNTNLFLLVILSLKNFLNFLLQQKKVYHPLFYFYPTFRDNIIFYIYIRKLRKLLWYNNYLLGIGIQITGPPA